jgi:hypothetical protein
MIFRLADELVRRNASAIFRHISHDEWYVRDRTHLRTSLREAMIIAAQSFNFRSDESFEPWAAHIIIIERAVKIWRKERSRQGMLPGI